MLAAKVLLQEQTLAASTQATPAIGAEEKTGDESAPWKWTRTLVGSGTQKLSSPAENTNVELREDGLSFQ